MNANPTQKPPKAPLRLHRHEPVARGIRRIARGQIDAACRVLEDPREDPRRAVHEARKALKRLRALLRLAAPRFGCVQFRREKAHFQEAARLLAPLRDAEARGKTLDALIHACGGSPAAFGRVRAGLQTATERLARRAGTPRKRAAEILRQARARVARWPLAGLGWPDLPREIRRAYRKGRKALKAYHAEPGPETFHTWRKRVKELWYHLQIVRGLLPEAAAERIAELDKIGETAGSAHDLSVLREILAAGPGDAATALLIGEIDARLPELFQNAAKLGAAVYAEKPRAFARRLGQRRGEKKGRRGDAEKGREEALPRQNGKKAGH